MIRRPKNRSGLARWIEVTLAFLGLVVFSPVLAVAGALVVLTSSGPALFRQTRIGRHGVPFTLLKLRTMRESSKGPAFTVRDDARITAVGAVLRRTKLDELPELWNVVRGDMSLVGPRPEVPSLVDASDERWRVVLDARPGLTDPVTLSLRDEELVLAHIDGDRERYYRDVLQPYKLDGYRRYLERRSAASDCAVIARTIAAIIVPRSAPTPNVDGVRPPVRSV